MADCATEKMRFETPAKLVLEAAFDGGRLTSDGGLAWLAKADGELGCARLWPATCRSGEKEKADTRCSR